MNRIMVATDFSERSDRALRRATLLARQSGASLILVNAIDDDRPQHIFKEEKRQAEALLRELASTVRSVDGVECEARVKPRGTLPLISWSSARITAIFSGISLLARQRNERFVRPVAPS
jgi:nucleotide-binding universal stress UspA family protein